MISFTYLTGWSPDKTWGSNQEAQMEEKWARWVLILLGLWSLLYLGTCLAADWCEYFSEHQVWVWTWSQDLPLEGSNCRKEMQYPWLPWACRKQIHSIGQFLSLPILSPTLLWRLRCFFLRVILSIYMYRPEFFSAHCLVPKIALDYFLKSNAKAYFSIKYTWFLFEG